MRQAPIKELCARYADKNLEEELAEFAERFSYSYIDKETAERIRWMCHAALERIREMEEVLEDAGD